MYPADTAIQLMRWQTLNGLTSDLATSPRFGKLQEEFNQFSDRDFADRVPAEDDILRYIRFRQKGTKLKEAAYF